MAGSSGEHSSDASADESWVLSSLERDQLVEEKQPIRRRRLKGPELALIWVLRVYLIFMLTAVVFQILHSGGH